MCPCPNQIVNVKNAHVNIIFIMILLSYLCEFSILLLILDNNTIEIS